MNIDPRVLGFIDPTLAEMLAWAEHTTGLTFNTSSIFRPDDVDSVHGQIPVRGYDVRCRVESIGLAIEQHVNAHWLYDPVRPDKKCCMFHDDGGGPHLHFQVHPRTRALK